MAVANIKIEPMKVLLDGVDLGCTDGDMSFNLTEEVLDITCHQHGAQILDKKRTAINMEVSVVLKEVSTAQLNTLFQFAGQTYTPAGGDAVVGIGTKKIGTSQFDDALKLVLHPVGAAALDYSRDHTFFKAYPTINNVTFSGENPVMVDVTFAVFVDEGNVTDADIYVFGDTTSVDQVFTP
jgi:hypothetical protein